MAIGNVLQALTNVTNNSILHIAGVLDTPLNEALSVEEVSRSHGK